MINNNISNIEEHIESILKKTHPLGETLWQVLIKEHPAEIAKLIERLDEKYQVQVLEKLPQTIAAKTFIFLSDTSQGYLIQKIHLDTAAHILQDIPVDKLTDLFENMSDHDVKKYLNLLQSKQRKLVISLLSFNPQSAGGIMDSDVLTLHKDFTIQKSISLLQKIRPVKKHIETIYVTDENNQLVGNVHINDLILNKPDMSLKDLVHENDVIINVTDDQETVAKKMKHHDLHSVPVIDAHNHFLGIITADDIFDIIEKEASEDVYKISGISYMAHTYFQTPFWKLIWTRSPWLVGLLILQSASGIIMQTYQKFLDDNITLSFFLTMLIGTGGNAGNQTGALVIRGLVTGEISRKNSIKVLLREFSISIVMAFILSCVAFARVLTTPHTTIILGLAISFSLFVITVVAMFIGALIPLLLERFNLDPANSAQPFLATIMDIIGVFIYCLIAYKILNFYS